MNKKIAPEVAFGIIILASVLFGGIFWAEKRSKNSNQQNLLTPNQNVLVVEENNIAQAKIDELEKKYGVTFDLPDKEWSFNENDTREDNEKSVYFFKRNSILSSNNIAVSPAIGIIFENVGAGVNVLEYSNYMINQEPKLETKKLLSEEDGDIFSQGAIGFQGESVYADGNVHTIFSIFIMKNGVAINVVLDTFKDIYPQMQQDFLQFIKSINIHPEENKINNKPVVIRNKVGDKFYAQVGITDKAYIDSWYNTETSSIPMGGEFFNSVKAGQDVYFPISYTNFGLNEYKQPSIYGAITLSNPDGKVLIEKNYSVTKSKSIMDPHLFYLVDQTIGYHFGNDLELEPLGEYTLKVDISDKISGEQKEIIKKFQKTN